MIILFGYDYIDTLKFESFRVKVKCRLIFSNDGEVWAYINNIRAFYNPNKHDHEKYRIQKAKVIKLKDGHMQFVTKIMEEYEEDIE